MTLIGWDLATRKMGFCAGDGTQLPIAGAILLPQVGVDMGKMGGLFLEGVRQLVDRFRPTTFLIESPILNPKRDVLLTLRKIYGASFLLETYAYEHGIRCVEADCRRVKRELTGKPNADKDDMVDMALRLGVQLPPTDAEGRKDAADALGAWSLCLRLYGNKAASAAWDQRLYGPKREMLI